MNPDPMQVVHDALESAGCKPTGPLHRYKAKCPSHQDRSPSLSIAEGSDGRVLLHCFAGCKTQSIVATLGLEVADLFPSGHRKGHRRQPKSTRNLSPAEALIVALTRVGIRWSGLISSECPMCGFTGEIWWRIRPEGVDVDCPEGCSREEIVQALNNRLVIEEAVQ